MKVTVCNEITENKQIEFVKSFWTGRISLKYDNHPMVKLHKNSYIFTDNEGVTQSVTVQGNELTSIDLYINNGKVNILRKLEWYEYVLALLPAILVLIGGAIGGALGAIGFITISILCRNITNVFLRVLMALIVTAIVTGTWYFATEFITSLF